LHLGDASLTGAGRVPARAAQNENTLTIISMADHNNPEMLSRVTYDNVYYTHQGWLTEDQTHLFLDDELDESRGPEPRTRTMIWCAQRTPAPPAPQSPRSSATSACRRWEHVSPPPL
jgi:hypothetical protein